MRPATIAIVATLGAPGCARMTLHAARPDPRAMLAAVRFEADADGAAPTRVTTADARGALRTCEAPCAMPLPVGRAEVAVRGPAHFVQGIDVPAEGARYVLVDPSRARRLATRPVVIGATVAAGTGLLLSLTGLAIYLNDALDCATRPGDATPCSRRGVGLSVTGGALAGGGLVTLVVAVLVGASGERARLERRPLVGAGVVPVAGGALAGATLGF